MSASKHYFPFLSLLRLSKNPTVVQQPTDEKLHKAEAFFLNLFEIGLFETYEFLYQKCTSDLAFENWLIDLKGEDFYEEKRIVFNNWYENKTVQGFATLKEILSSTELEFWGKYGYLQLSNIIPAHDCDDVVSFIIDTLSLDLNNSDTWYPKHEKRQGLMLQIYQGAAIEKIRKNEKVFQIFSQLYGTSNIIANCEKVSYNPPETTSFKFQGSSLHWDIDYRRGVRYYIQGLVYLNDVPTDRGAFTLVPGYQDKTESLLRQYSSEEAIAMVSKSEKIEYLAGKKGDLILWLESIPHAASPNHSDLPRFVQYVSFNKI